MVESFQDIELIKSFKQGNQNAFSELVMRYQKPIYYFALGVVSNHHMAEEISQEAFIKLWRSLQSGGFDETRPVYPWLRTVSLNLAKDYITDAKRRMQATKEIALKESVDCEESNAVINNESRNKISEAIESVDAERRIVLTLRIVEGLSYKEISQQLNCSIGTVMSRLFRARMELKSKLRIMSDEL
jgi:RNA polymerase sigma-70 factor (ECF subfamily)